VEKIIHDLDRPKPEVLIDVVVMETSRNTQRTLSAALASVANGTLAPGLSSNILFTPRNPVLFGNTGNNSNNNNGTNNTNNGTNTSNTGTNNGTNTNTNTGVNTGITGTTGTGTTGTTVPQQYIALSKIGKISTNDFSTTLPGALIQALLQDSTTRVLNRPQLRATDGGKASLKIGSKIPYVSGSLNSAVATPGSIPYATTQFQQVDVGVNMDMEPRVNGPDDISLHLKVELSQVSGNQDIAGVLQPIISQHVNEANIRLKNGEVSILGGLNQNSDSITNSGIPGLLNVPVLGYLFGSRNKQHVDDQILVALIPHIIRAPDLAAMGEQPIETGTENNFKVLRSIPSSAEVNVQQGEANPAQPAPLERGPVSGLAPGSPPIPVQPQPQQPQYPVQVPVNPQVGPQPPSGQTQYPPGQPLPAGPGVRPAPQIQNVNPAPPITPNPQQQQHQQPQQQQQGGQRP
jgi:general secretion pathway protein D